MHVKVCVAPAMLRRFYPTDLRLHTEQPDPERRVSVSPNREETKTNFRLPLQIKPHNYDRVVY